MYYIIGILGDRYPISLSQMVIFNNSCDISMMECNKSFQIYKQINLKCSTHNCAVSVFKFSKKLTCVFHR